MKLSDLTGNAPVVAMLGMCKNAGKTTALNRLINEYRESGRRLAVTSVGRDGERVDVVTGTAKPPIYIYEGMLAASASGLLALSDVTREILDVTDTMTPLGRVVVFRARSDGYVQLAGPSVISDMSRLRGMLHGYGAETVLIDGALNRRSPAAGAFGGVCVLSTGASLGRDIDAVVEETAFICSILTLPEDDPGILGTGKFTAFRGTGAKSAEGTVGTEDTASAEDTASTEDTASAEDADGLCTLLKGFDAEGILFSGALTDTTARTIMQSGAKLGGLRFVVDDSSRILIEKGTYEKLLSRGVKFRVKRGTKLAAVTVNPVSAGGWSFDAGAFLEKMRSAVSVPVLNALVNA